MASRTAPVQEVIRDGHNGWLVNFFDPEALAGKVVEVLGAAQGSQAISTAARRDAGERYSRALGLQAYDPMLTMPSLEAGPAQQTRYESHAFHTSAHHCGDVASARRAPAIPPKSQAKKLTDASTGGIR
jgi:hypothetical protein